MNVKTVDLICIPFAGGSKYSFRPFAEVSPNYIKIIGIEYSGHGMRIDEELCTKMEDLVNDVWQQIEPIITSKRVPYAFYAHSMGGIVTSLLLNRIVVAGLTLPIHVFITGAAAPSSRDVIKEKSHLLEDVEFIQKIRELGGVQEEVWNEPQIVEYVLPVLRADFMCYETYLYKEMEPVAIPFTVINGDIEDFTQEEILGWQNETIIPVDFITLSGNHFFIFEQLQQIINIISTKIKSSLS